MFIGHFATGFGAKALSRRTSLGTLFLAAQWIDLIWPTLLLLGWERVTIQPGATVVTPLIFAHYPISHSLLAVLGWGIGLAAVYRVLRSDARGAAVVGAVVVSHWLLDALVHQPDLPLLPGHQARVGLGLWNSLPLTVTIELLLFAVGVWLYAKNTRQTDRTGAWSLWGLVGFLALVYLVNLSGEPPPSATAIAWVGQAQWLIVAWGYWIDRHRAPRSAGSCSSLANGANCAKHQNH